MCEKRLHLSVKIASFRQHTGRMAQYHTAYWAHAYGQLARRITASEYAEVVDCARRLGLHRGIPFDKELAASLH